MLCSFLPQENKNVMSFKVHEIKQYNYSFDARSGGPGLNATMGNQRQGNRGDRLCGR